MTDSLRNTSTELQLGRFHHLQRFILVWSHRRVIDDRTWVMYYQHSTTRQLQLDWINQYHINEVISNQ
jgi:hypothetical protein